jgi:hypothetical protein
MASPEFESRALTFGDFVTILYRTFLGREPDGPGLAGWVAVLRDTMLQIINTGFVPSTEFQGQSAALCPSTIPDIRGTYSGTLTETITGCSDPLDNGTASGTLRVTISSQSGGTFSGSAVLTVGGVITTFTSFGGSVNSAGTISGLFQYVGAGFSGQGTFSGTASGGRLTGTVTGRDAPPDNCNFTGQFSVSR